MFENIFNIIASIGFISVMLWFILGAKNSVNLNNYSEKELKRKQKNKEEEKD